MRALNTAATGMLAQQLNVEVISNNIANMNTTGFKRQRAEFQDLLYQNASAWASPRRTPAPSCRPACRSASASRPAAVYRDHRAGQLSARPTTARHRDQGRGLFQVADARRRDRLHPRRLFPAQSPTAQIVTADGYIVRSPAISIPQDAVDVTINRERRGAGRSAGRPDEPQTVGQIELARFANDGGPGSHRRQPVPGDRRLGRRRSPATPGSAGFGTVQSGLPRNLERQQR